MKLRLLLGSILLIATECAGQQISGKVARTGYNPKPLSDVEVTLEKKGSAKPIAATRTAKDGSFTFKSVPAGNYMVAASGQFDPKEPCKVRDRDGQPSNLDSFIKSKAVELVAQPVTRVDIEVKCEP